jgi:hypothetical protein
LITSQGIAIHSIPMSDITYCTDAGKDWVSSVRPLYSNERIRANWICKPTYTHREYR